jgi:Ca2+-binding EF-hand superfamily protein
MTSVSSSTSTTYAYQTAVSKLDTNGDGVISSDELAAAQPSKKDQQGSATTETDTDSTSALDKFSGEMMAMMLEMQQQSDGTDSGAQSSSEPSASDLFTAMDADGDGTVTQSEFLSARPDDVSEEDATSLFAALDTEGTGLLSEQQFTDGLQANQPPGPPPEMMPPELAAASADATASDTIDMADTLEDMKTAIAAYLENLAETSAEALDPIAV